MSELGQKQGRLGWECETRGFGTATNYLRVETQASKPKSGRLIEPAGKLAVPSSRIQRGLLGSVADFVVVP